MGGEFELQTLWQILSLFVFDPPLKENVGDQKHIWYLPTISNDCVGLEVRKPVFGVLQTTHTQTSLRIRADDQRLCYSLFRKYHM